MTDQPLPTALMRLRLGQEDAHYGGNLVAGGRQMEILGDLATELAMRYDGDEGLLRAYESVEFLAPLFAGDWIEARGTIVEVGATSRKCEFEIWKVGTARLDVSESAAEFLAEPIQTLRAVGTTVVPKGHQRMNH
ncbi:MAG: 3-aminobutyryl-CoA ammonia lyase [Chloroflexi bacterium]|nr:3-aminobutyryl-CoA ammonia lyase [Chloroflexota bacterium]MDA1145793.1 3-aminobutyryl-CoA ammonia lyase [Chloroflexota bacterium]